MSNVNGSDCGSSSSSIQSTPDSIQQDDGAEVTSWMRWWHWLIVAGLFFAAFMYYPLWRFEQKWRQLQIGDSVDRVEELFGELDKPSYSVQGARAADDADAFLYTVYWKSYEVQISRDGRRVTAKSIIVGSGTRK